MLKDKDIREPLFSFIEEKFGKVRIIEEKQIKKSRADCMLVTEDSLIGIEIKSDADSYARLDRQIQDYNRFFDYNYVAVGPSHAKSATDHVPQWWGIITVSDRNEEEVPMVEIVRQGTPNPKREKMVKLRNQLSILWRPELNNLLEINEMPKYKQKSKDFVIRKIAEKIDVEVLKPQISNELFERDYTTIAERIAEYKEGEKKKVKRRQVKK